MVVTIALFVAGLLLLIKGGDWFVDGATAIAHHFHVSELLIGATVVAIGTTLPEVMVSCISAASGHGEIAFGNAIGSVICNTALIAAVTVAVRPSKVDGNAFRTPVVFFFASALAYYLTALFFREFSRLFGCFLLLIFLAYVLSTVLQARKDGGEPQENAAGEANGSMWRQYVLLVVGAVAIAGGAKLLVDSATVIAKSLGVPESVIGLTLVAFGTSLPEFTTAVISLVKGHSSLSLGNIIGANIFNIVLVSGMSIVLAPFKIPSGKMLWGMPTSLAVDTPVMFAVMLLLTVPALVFKRMYKIQGIALLLLYAAYCIFLFCY